LIAYDNPEVSKLYADDVVHDQNLMINPGSYKLTSLRGDNTVLNFSEMICMGNPNQNFRKGSIDFDNKDDDKD